MPDIISLLIIVALAAVVVYGLHVLKEMRNELGVRQRVTALEAKVFPVVLTVEPVTPPERLTRARKSKVV